MATELRVRRSLRELELLENRKDLDKLVRAFRGIQQLPPDHDNSFFQIAGYHGEPFVKSGPGYVWGGYCFHQAVLFPTWHRAYCLRIEDALRSIEGCEDVTLPYWDELAEDGNPKPVPEILTSPEYVLDGETIPNPLFSYALQSNLVDAKEKMDRYTKHEGYSTVRFPLSGLVGTAEDQEQTKVWNEKFPKPSEQLNWNIRNWLMGKVDIEPIQDVTMADTYSVVARMRKCMDAPNWTVFSNKASAEEYAKMHGQDPTKHWVVSLEEPHNAIHLALGGHFQPATGLPPGSKGYNANPKDFQNANGDMGCNETAAFDPVFYMHHCFIDYMMWCWQKKHNKTTRGSLEIDYSIQKGTSMDEGGNAALGNGEKMEMTTPLKPFRKPNSDKYWTSDELTDIAELGYMYAPGSFEISGLTPKSVGSIEDFKSSSENDEPIQLVALKQTAAVKVNKYSGSFVIRTYATINGKKVEIGRDAILSRYNFDTCGNCQNSPEAFSIVPVDKALAETLDPEKTRKIPYTVEIQYLGGQEEYRPEAGGGLDSVEDQVIEY